MSDASKAVRPSKRDVIVLDDEESANDQPAAKTVKNEAESVSSSEVVRQNKSKESFQCARGAKREVEPLAMFAEKLLDSNQSVKENYDKEKVKELERKLRDALNKLEGATRREERACSNSRQLAQEKEVLSGTVADMEKILRHGIEGNDALQESLDAASRQLEEARRDAERAFADNIELSLKHNVLKTEMTDMKKEQQERIDELTVKLAHFERRSQSLLAQLAQNKEQECSIQLPVQVPSLVVDDLQKKLLKTEAKFQRAVRANREVEFRAERAENLLDSKNGLIEGKDKEKVEELNNKLAEVSSRLEKVKTRAENAFTQKIELARENEVLKTEVDTLKRCTGPSCKHGSSIIELQSKVIFLTNQLEEEQRQAIQDRMKYCARIDELMHNLAQYNGGPQPVDIDHPTNIFQLYRQDSNESISYDNACEKLLSSSMELEGETLDKKLSQCFARHPKLDSLVLHCPLCVAIFNKTAIIQHFLSKGHQMMLFNHNSGVSRAAFNFWLGKLQLPNAAVAAAAIPAQQPASAAISSSQLPDVAEASHTSDKCQQARGFEEDVIVID